MLPDSIRTRIPPIRASDCDLAIRDPFLYFLKIRCGLTSLLSYSKALSRGSWFHKALELDGNPRSYEYTIQSRIDELLIGIEELNISPDKIQGMVERETKDALISSAIYEAAKTILAVPLPGTGEFVTFPEYLGQYNWQLLARELLLWDQSTFSACQLDALYLDKTTKQLWILDAKTTDTRTDIRGQLCPIEFATPHYLSILRNLRPQIIAKFGLDGGTTVGGMMHLIIQKPSIEMSGEDRDFRFVEHTLKSGPRKGQIEMRKEFLSDEPKLDNFVSRCVRWMKGEGEYLDKQPERDAYPCVNMSWTTLSGAFDGERGSSYQTRYQYLNELSSEVDEPKLFKKNVSGLLEFGKLSPYAPFYLCPVEQWPEIIHRNGFIQLFRNPEITDDTPSFVGTPTNASTPASV